MPFVICSTVSETFLERVKTTPNAHAFQYKTQSQWMTVSFKEFYEESREVSTGLMALGAKARDKIAILSNSRYQWVICDMAILGANSITIPIYASSTAEDAAWILNHSDTKIVFVENEPQLKKILSQQNALPLLEKIIVFDSKGIHPANTKIEILSFSELRKIGRHEASRALKRFEQNLKSAKAEDLLTICYTSGTTGVPKGAMITHANMMSVLEDCCKTFSSYLKPEQEVDLLYLPFSHIIGKVESMAPSVFGWKGCFAESMDHVSANLIEVRPTILFSVPRIFEKAYNRILESIESELPLKKNLFHWALDISRNYHQFGEKNRRSPLVLSAKYGLAQKLVFNKIRNRFGGRLKFALCGGAPLSTEIAEFFKCVGIPLLEGYGLTETCGPIAINTPQNNQIGSVGCPFSEVAIRTGDDGEILIRSKKIFQGYYKMPEESSEALEEGWFHTGDIGVLDDDGFLHITDRKKDLIITSGGKNIAPQKIENLMKAQKYINQFIVHGDRRPYLTALATLHRDQILQYAHENKILFSDYGSLLQNSKIQSLTQKEVDLVNAKLASFERIKKFMLLPHDFTIESGELTPSLKVKRSLIEKKYKTELDRMYADT